MTLHTPLRRMAAVGLAAALSLLLSACLVTPGKFLATLDLRKDGTFTYTYKGEIFVLGLSELMKAGAKADEPFVEHTCFNDDTGAERPCTKDEIAQQKEEWEADRKSAAERRQKELETAKAMLGGLDPSDPRAAEELASRLRRQAGFNAVTYKGNGIYEVDFRVAGRLDHDFAFPTIEKMAQVVPFFVLNRRTDGSVRFDSPALNGEMNGAAPFGSLGAMIAAEGGKGGEEMPNLPQPDGKFILTTDGTILANNTDEGPKADPAGKRLEWTISPREKAGPMALIGLGK
ncbi:MAG TPA: hypothetical protein PK680_06405 [Novosphingobium sp.]|nr:hypothetical protein [Novosphingobium sp.]HQA17999.1 hypothetical protein [Novosphingobium sp.]